MPLDAGKNNGIRKRERKMEMTIKTAMATLAGGVNLSHKWEASAKEENHTLEGFKLETLREYFETAMKELAPLVGGYVPGNLNQK